ASVLMIGLLSYSLYSILSSHLLERTRESLDKEVELASHDVQREFANLKDDLSYYSDKIVSAENSVDQDRIKKLLINYSQIIDTLYFRQEAQRFFFVLDDNNNLKKSIYPGEAPPLNNANHLSVPSSSGNQELR